MYNKTYNVFYLQKITVGVRLYYNNIFVKSKSHLKTWYFFSYFTILFFILLYKHQHDLTKLYLF